MNREIGEQFASIMLESKPSATLREWANSGKLSLYVPELYALIGLQQPKKYHCMDAFDHSMTVLDHVMPKLRLRLAACFHDVGKALTYSNENGEIHFLQHERYSARLIKQIFKRWEYDSKLTEEVRKLVRNHMFCWNKTCSIKSFRKLIGRVGFELADDLLLLRNADRIAGKPVREDHWLEKMNALLERVKTEGLVPENKQHVALRTLAVNGHDMLKIGLKGQQIGQALEYLLEVVTKNPSLNEKDILLDMVDKASL